MKQELRQTDWEVMLQGDTEACWAKFKEKLRSLEKTYVPKRVTSNKIRKPIWMTHRAVKLVAKKKKVYAKYKDRKHPAVKNANGMAKKAILAAKKNFERKLAQNIKQDTKSFFAYARSRSRSRIAPGPLVDDSGNDVESPSDITEEFNRYFASVFVQEDPGSISEPERMFNKADLDCLEDLEFTETDILKKFIKIRDDKAPGADDIMPRMIHNIRDEICRPLWIIFRKSLDQGIVPEDWRRANISPLFKNGNRNRAENYRPVSLTSQVCKVFESLLRDVMVGHLERHQLLKDSQHGFRKGRSCMTNLLTLLEKVTKYLDEGDAVDIIFLDFAKAFDKVPHHRLIKKLRSHGINGKIARWVEAWLSGRSQRTCIAGCGSSWRWVSSGVPQGSVLGPILFLLYINDLENGVMSWILKFADDTKIFGKANSIEDKNLLQKDLDRLIEWSLEWLMMFNTKKCKVMHIGSRNNQYTYTMNQQKLEVVNTERDLGIIISKDMKVSKQCEHAYSKASRILGLLNRTIKFKDEGIMVRLYKALVRPHVEYCASTWSPGYKKDIELIEKIQHRFTRMLSTLKGKSYEERNESLGLWSLEERRHRSDLIEVFKLLKGMTNATPELFFELDSSSRTRGHSLKLVKKRFNITVRQHMFSQRVVNRWNALDQRTVDSESVNEFKSNLSRLRKCRMGLFMD